MESLKQLVEETFKNAQNRPVVLLGHSMGGLYALNFLNRQTKEWKQKYVKSYISVSAPFGGSLRALLSITSGENFGIFLRNPLHYRPILRSFSSIISNLPDPRVWSEDEPIISTPTKNYTVKDYSTLFNDINFSLGYDIMLKAKENFKTLEAPKDVREVYCIYSSGLLTIKKLVYKAEGKSRSAFPDQVPMLVYGDGDGTVTMKSLSICNGWPNANIIHLTASNHVPILSDKRFLKFIMSHVVS
ncbi:unnamed protein product [Heterobilharzia americana]|nr:unnamed protein product [Heterobilharzia americana]CAH8608077.1 unnamed protein product [Heterobilharzia americana]